MTNIFPSRMSWNFQASLLVPQASVSVCDVTSHLVAGLVPHLCFAGSGCPFLSAPPGCVQSNIRMFFVNKLLPCHSSRVFSSCSSLPCATLYTPQPLPQDPPTARPLLASSSKCSACLPGRCHHMTWARVSSYYRSLAPKTLTGASTVEHPGVLPL